MRRTKIVATLGPATREVASVREVLAAGADVVRLNAAHGTADEHELAAQTAREVADGLGRSVGLLVDLPGPKLRTGPVVNDEVELHTGATFGLVADHVDGDDRRVATTVPDLAAWVEPGDEVFLADGEIVLRVERIDGRDLITEVVRGGVLRSRKGMHVPRAEAFVDPFTETDAAALDLALSLKADFVGLSFVRNADDVAKVRDALPKRGTKPQLVAKIETAAALDDMPRIIAASDAVMVARGDLAIQVAPQRVPLLQKSIIRACNAAARPVITATQMLESMTRSRLPTRAEVNDVANAVIDGTDALMLSEETAVGRFAADAVRTMAETAIAAEAWPREPPTPDPGDAVSDRVAWAVAHAAIAAAEDLDVAAILCPTRTGRTPRHVAAFRPAVPIVGLSGRRRVLGGLTLSWGVHPLPLPPGADDETDLDAALTAARRAGVVHTDDLVAVVAGSPGPRAGSTDYVRIVKV